MRCSEMSSFSVDACDSCGLESSIRFLRFDFVTTPSLEH